MTVEEKFEIFVLRHVLVAAAASSAASSSTFLFLFFINWTIRSEAFSTDMFKFWYALLRYLILIMILDHFDRLYNSWKLQLLILKSYLWYLMVESYGYERLDYVIIQLLEMPRSLKLRKNKQFGFG